MIEDLQTTVIVGAAIGMFVGLTIRFLRGGFSDFGGTEEDASAPVKERVRRKQPWDREEPVEQEELSGDEHEMTYDDGTGKHVADLSSEDMTGGVAPHMDDGAGVMLYEPKGDTGGKK